MWWLWIDCQIGGPVSATAPAIAPTADKPAAAFNGMVTAEMENTQVLLQCQISYLISKDPTYQRAAVGDQPCD